jgi:hypothetical protein
MQSSSWAALLQFIPPTEQDKLMLVTTSGIEIALQAILRVDPECLAIKGRLAGSTDSGRVFFIPYDRIDYFGYQQPVKESDFHELFSRFSFPAEGCEQEQPSERAEPPEQASVRSPASTLQRTPAPIKSAVLERFRSRLSAPSLPNRPPEEGQ